MKINKLAWSDPELEELTPEALELKSLSPEKESKKNPKTHKVKTSAMGEEMVDLSHREALYRRIKE